VTTTGPGRVGGLLETAGEGSRRRARNLQLNEIHVVRFVPGTSPLHRMWAGPSSSRSAALDCSACLAVMEIDRHRGRAGARRVPGGASAAGNQPRLPWWLGGVVAAGAVLASYPAAGRKPTSVRSGSALEVLATSCAFRWWGSTCSRVPRCSVGRRLWPTCRPLWGGCSARCATSRARRRACRCDSALHQMPAVAARRGAGAAGSSQGSPAGQPSVVQGTWRRVRRSRFRGSRQRDQTGTGDRRGDRGERRCADRCS